MLDVRLNRADRDSASVVVERGLGVVVMSTLGRLMGFGRLEIVLSAVIVAGASAIAINALALQTERHPNPIAAAPAQDATPPKAPVAASKPVSQPAAAVVAPRAETTGSLAPRPVPRPASLGGAAPLTVAAAAAPDANRRQRTQIVADLQRELGRRGYYEGPADGIFGSKTDAAIRDVESALGWRESGEPTEALLAAVRRIEARGAHRPPAAVGSQPRILAVQRALASIGYGPLRTDGRASPETRAAIQRFERDRNMPVTGDMSDRIIRELASVSGIPIE